MEDSKKKPVMIGVIVVCLIAAAVIFIKTSSQDSASTAKGQMIWIKCADEACGAEYQMDSEKFGLAIMKGGMPSTIPVLVCEKCGKETAYRAEKCPKCGTVFFKGAMGEQKFPDTCPKCGFSAVEEEQNAAAEKKQ